MQESTVTSLPMSLPESPFGIVIHSGEPPKRPALIWAYMWAEDQRDELGALAPAYSRQS